MSDDGLAFMEARASSRERGFFSLAADLGDVSSAIILRLPECSHTYHGQHPGI